LYALKNLFQQNIAYKRQNPSKMSRFLANMNVYTRWPFFQGVQTSKYIRQTIVTRGYKQKEGDRVNQKSSANKAGWPSPLFRNRNQRRERSEGLP
jgi:hypothetical protein